MHFFKTKPSVALALIILFLYLSPLVIMGEDSYILIHDNLDSNLVWFKTLVESNSIFASSSALLEVLMNAPRSSLGNEFDFQVLLYLMLDPYWAYVVNQILIRIVALIGMYLLLNKYIFANDYKPYGVFIALLYSLLPFWPSGGLSIAGLPLISYVFLNIYNRQDKKVDWLVLLLFPFYSSFIFSMMFYIAFLGMVWSHDTFTKKLNKKFTFALFIFILLFLLINYRLIEVFIFGSDFISHRTERISEYYGLISALKTSLIHFVFGQYHAHSIHIIFLPFICFMFILALFSKQRDNVFIGLFILNLIISLWYGFWKYEGMAYIRESFSLLKSLNLSRFHTLTPLIWYVLLAFSIKQIFVNYHTRYIKYVINIMLIAGVSFMFYQSDFVQEYKKSGISYKAFYSEALFDAVEAKIEEDQSSYKVVSIGIHPLIARYNGFYTLDGYLPNYALKYKKQFRTVIVGELEKSEQIKRSFDHWGNRCYLFSKDIGYNFMRTKDETYPITIDFNKNEFKNMGGKYIFSTYKIVNDEDNDFDLIDIFEDVKSPWKIYLYKVI